MHCLLQSYVMFRSQYITCNGAKSDVKFVESDLPHRSILRPFVAIPTDREFTSPSRYAISMVARASSSLGVTCLGDPLVKLEYPTSLSNTN